MLYRPGGDNYWSLTWNWYPTGILWAMEAFTYHAVVKTKKPFTAFSNGRTVRRWEEGDLACAEFQEDKPIQGASILAGRYTTYSEGNLFKVSVPSNWQELASENSVTFAPEGARAQLVPTKPSCNRRRHDRDWRALSPEPLR